LEKWRHSSNLLYEQNPEVTRFYKKFDILSNIPEVDSRNSSNITCKSFRLKGRNYDESNDEDGAHHRVSNHKRQKDFSYSERYLCRHHNMSLNSISDLISQHDF